jgi:hypothetical protein
VLTAISCPDCDVPAEITERFSLPSTDGAVDHIVVRCAGGHCFRMAADRLPSHQQQEQPHGNQQPERPPVMITPSGCAVRA